MITAEGLTKKLDKDCPSTGIEPSDRVNKEAVLDDFAESDSNGDDFLDGLELGKFIKTLVIYQECISVAQGQQ